MRYEKQILAAYDRLGFKPRDNQVDAINQICMACLDENKKHIILSAPTGTGKSVISAVAAEVIHEIRYPDHHKDASFLLTATNVLAAQYRDTFIDEDDPLNTNFVMVKGANNYGCAALSTKEEPQTAENCAVMLFRKSKMDDIIASTCDVCEYAQMKAVRNKARHLITNYSYYFVDRLYTRLLEKRTMCIFDEAHLLNDLFVEHNAIFFSEKRLAQYVEEINEHLQLGDANIYRTIKKVKDALIAGKITEENFTEYLKAIAEVYQEVHLAAKAAAESNVRNQSKYLKLNKLAKKYFGLHCKIDDFFIFGYPHVFEYKAKDPKKGQQDHEVSVKPIFVGAMFDTLINADFNLLMSATIDMEYVKRTMNLDPVETKYIKLPPSFPIENKKVVFFKPMTLNYNTMKDQAVVKKMCATTYEIVKHHTDKGERGLVLCPSFAVVESISEVLRMMKGGYRVFEHQRGDKLADVLEEFKDYTGGPAVILSPSGYEGVDLPGDQARYTVVVKAPFGSLGDKRIQTILEQYPDIYSRTTLMKLTQGAGRAVRSAEDYATTYFLDTAIQRLWSRDNPWTDEFMTCYSSTLID